MNAESPASKHRYDITKSRRTRKQLAFDLKGRSEQGEAKRKDNSNSNSNGNIVVSLENLLEVKEDDDHKSLKQLINGDHHHHENDNNKGRNSLGQHFNEEEKNNLQVVKRNNQHESVQQGLKLKKLVRRYAKLLGQHLIKPKPDSPNKSLFKLSK